MLVLENLAIHVFLSGVCYIYCWSWQSFSFSQMSTRQFYSACQEVDAIYIPFVCSPGDSPALDFEVAPFSGGSKMSVVCQPLCPGYASAKTEPSDRVPILGLTPNFAEALAAAMCTPPASFRQSRRSQSLLAAPASREEKTRTLIEWKARTEYLEHQLKVFMETQTVFKGVPVDWADAMELVQGKVCALERQLSAVRAENEELMRLKTKKGMAELQSLIGTLRIENEELRRKNEALQFEASPRSKQYYQTAAAKEAGGDKEKQDLIYKLANVRHSERRLVQQLEAVRVENLRLSSLVSNYAKRPSVSSSDGGWFSDVLWSVPTDGQPLLH